MWDSQAFLPLLNHSICIDFAKLTEKLSIYFQYSIHSHKLVHFQ